MLERWLSELTELDVVEGVFVCSNRGVVLDRMGGEYDNKQLESIAILILRFLSAYELLQQHVNEFEIIWQKKSLLGKNTNGFIIIAICNSAKGISLARMTLNVVLANILEDKKFMKKINKDRTDKAEVLKKGSLDEDEINLISKLQ